MQAWLERTFKLKEHKTSVSIELMAGLTTFMTMAYILVVNAGILADGAGMDFKAVVIATAVSSAVATFLMGFWANYPFALAPGMGLNAYFAFTIVGARGFTVPDALAAVFFSGVVFLILTLTGVREAIIRAIPDSLKAGVAAGIGLFIAFIGFSNAGISIASPVTITDLGDLTASGPFIAFLGLLLTGALMALKIRGAILWGIIGTTIIAAFGGLVNAPSSWFELPTWGTWSQVAFQLNLRAIFSTLIWEFIFVFFFVDLFDTIGTLVGVSKRVGFLNEKGELPRARQALLADSIGTIFGSLSGTPTVTTYVESAAGVAAGGRTGLTAVTVGVLFLLALFFAPVFAIVPGIATAPALIIVGVLMMKAIVDVNWDDMSEALPAFIAAVAMPFTFSISNGIALGFIAYSVVKILSGKWKDVNWLIHVIAIAFVVKFIFL